MTRQFIGEVLCACTDVHFVLFESSFLFSFLVYLSLIKSSDLFISFVKTISMRLLSLPKLNLAYWIGSVLDSNSQIVFWQLLLILFVHLFIGTSSHQVVLSCTEWRICSCTESSPKNPLVILYLFDVSWKSKNSWNRYLRYTFTKRNVYKI